MARIGVARSSQRVHCFVQQRTGQEYSYLKLSKCSKTHPVSPLKYIIVAMFHSQLIAQRMWQWIILNLVLPPLPVLVHSASLCS